MTSGPLSSTERSQMPKAALPRIPSIRAVEGDGGFITGDERQSDGLASDSREDVPKEFVDELPPFPSPLRRPIAALSWVVRTMFGFVSLSVLLAIIAAIPVVNFLALGYLLESEGRMGRNGRWRSAVPLLNQAPRLGTIAIGCWIWLLPLRLLSTAIADARLIAPDGTAAAKLTVVTNLFAGFVAFHLTTAIAFGGNLGSFFRPIRNLRWLLRRMRSGEQWERAAGSVRAFFAGFQLRRHFWLGLRGFAAAAIWLWPPTIVFAALKSTERPGPALVTLLGGLLLIPVLTWMPFLQARFAAENRFRAGLEWQSVRTLFRRAPVSWLLAIVVVYLLSLPLYLFKIASPPQDAMWGLTLVFIISILPARLITGWAYHRAVCATEESSRWVIRGCKLLAVPVLAAYLFLLFFTPFISEHGRAVLFEHHAFLLPVPF